MSLEVYLRAWIVTPFRGIFSIINVLARSRSNQLRILSLRDQLRACLHEGGGPQVGEVTCGRLPHLTCKRDHIKIRDCMDRRVTPPKRVTSPSWGPPPPCKQALRKYFLSFPFYSSWKKMIFFCDIYVIETAFRRSFLNSSLASFFCPCLQRVKPSVRDSSRFLINHTKNNGQIKLNSYGLKWIENLR